MDKGWVVIIGFVVLWLIWIISDSTLIDFLSLGLWLLLVSKVWN